MKLWTRITHRQRLRGDHGSGAVMMITGIFALTFGSVVWLSVDVDRSLSNRSTAQSVAFQAARSGAQQVDVETLRTSGDVIVNAAQADAAAKSTASSLFDSYGVSGKVDSVVVDGASVSVKLTVTDTDATVTGQATVRAERSP